MPSIINSDNGATSGSAGLKVLAAEDGVLEIQNNGVTAITVGTTQQATFSAPVSQPGSFMFRNKIINGNFDVWQRGTSQTTSGYGSVDRWQPAHAGSTKTASQQTFALGQTDVPNNPKYFMRHVVTSVAGAGNYVIMQQAIEGVETLAGQTATVSFWAKADATKNIAVEFEQVFGTGGSPSTRIDEIGSQLVALTTSWTKHTITVNIPSVSGKTLGTAGNDQLRYLFWFDAGSNFDARSASLGQQSGTFDIAQVQVEEGAAATPFEMRPIGTELTFCQRYFCKSYNLNQNPGTITGQYTGGTSAWFETQQSYHQLHTVTLSPSMRSNPSIIIYNPTTGATSSLWAAFSGNRPAYVSHSNSNSFTIGINNSSIPGGQGGFAHFTATAEL